MYTQKLRIPLIAQHNIAGNPIRNIRNLKHYTIFK